jgi:hypothetical protein
VGLEAAESSCVLNDGQIAAFDGSRLDPDPEGIVLESWTEKLLDCHIAHGDVAVPGARPFQQVVCGRVQTGCSRKPLEIDSHFGSKGTVKPTGVA